MHKHQHATNSEEAAPAKLALVSNSAELDSTADTTAQLMATLLSSEAVQTLTTPTELLQKTPVPIPPTTLLSTYLRPTGPDTLPNYQCSTIFFSSCRRKFKYPVLPARNYTGKKKKRLFDQQTRSPTLIPFEVREKRNLVLTFPMFKNIT